MSGIILTDSDLEEIDKEAADDLIEAWEEEQKSWVKDNALGIPGSKKNPATRLQFYEQNTLQEERMLVLDPDYRDRRDEGLYPDLVPVHWFVLIEGQPVAGPFADEMTATMQAQAMGLWQPGIVDPMTMQPMMPPIGNKPSFWSLLFQLGQFPSGFSLFKHHGHDFKTLIETQARRMEQAMGVMV